MVQDNSGENNSNRFRKPGNNDRKKISNENVIFYYNREERLRKLKAIVSEKKRPGIFKKGGKRTLLVILIDILIISLFIYIINKPTNFYKKKYIGNVRYELNISRIKGKKVMFAITITNKANVPMIIGGKENITINIIYGKSNIYYFKKAISENTILKPDESTSVVFMIEESKLPKSGVVNVYIDKNINPIFSPKIRFYYFNL